MAPPNITLNPTIVYVPANVQTDRTVRITNNDHVLPQTNNDQVVFRIVNVPETHVFSDGDLDGFIARDETVEVNLSRLAADLPHGHEERIRIEFLRCEGYENDPSGVWVEHDENNPNGPDQQYYTSREIVIRRQLPQN
ncbi:hypothetical protein Ddc_13057 [Ditylenchus destructor]|nr:hypothetical protein Ddc_13057 [Ditylenchus destructor]